MFSVTGSKKLDTADAFYWKANMVSPVRFHKAGKEMLSEKEGPNYLVEIGPSGALAGPLSQIKKSLSSLRADISYCASWSRGVDAGNAIFDVAGCLFVAGGPINMA